MIMIMIIMIIIIIVIIIIIISIIIIIIINSPLRISLNLQNYHSPVLKGVKCLKS